MTSININVNEIEWPIIMQNSHAQESCLTTKKYLLYTITLYSNYLVSQINSLFKSAMSYLHIQVKSRWNWWNEIIPAANDQGALYLGAIPIVQKLCGKQVRNDFTELQQLGIGSVLSVTEPFETHSQGIFTSSVEPETWIKAGIHQLQLSTPDFGTITMDKIHLGVEFIRWNVIKGRSVYVHCKAGRGRSALIVLCYMMKYQEMSPEEAIQHIQQQRNQVQLEAEKWDTAREFFNNFCKKNEPSLAETSELQTLQFS